MTTETAATPQQRMKAQLEAVGLPFKTINCYGSQIVVTAWSRDAAVKWHSLLSRLGKVRGPVESMDRTKDASAYYKANPGLVKANFFHPVWIVGCSI